MSTNTHDLFDFDLFNLSVDRTAAVVSAMLGFDVLCWIAVMRGFVPMPGMTWLMMDAGIPMDAPGAMEAGVFHVGTLEAVAGYILMWGVMMWAMMYPAMTRFTREYADALRGSGPAVAAAVVLFLAGYNAVWALSGFIPLTFNALLPGGIYGFTHAHETLVVAGVLVLTGLYQLTHFKQSRLRTCCAHVSPRDVSLPGAVRTGLYHGVQCVLVCLGFFFLVMPFFGEMNFFWMVALTFPVTIERIPAKWGREMAFGSGVVCLVAGVAVVALGVDPTIAWTTSM